MMLYWAARSRDGLSSLTEEDEQAFSKAKPRLCKGIMSAAPWAFREKVYSALVKRVTGVSLYEEWIPPEKVREMYEARALRSQEDREGLL